MHTNSTINTHRNTTCHNDRQLHIPWQHHRQWEPNNSSFSDANRRIDIATSTMSKLSSLWTSSRLSPALKMRLYNSLIISIITYSSASWTLTKAQKKRLDAFNTKPSAAEWASAGTITSRTHQFLFAQHNHP